VWVTSTKRYWVILAERRSNEVGHGKNLMPNVEAGNDLDLDPSTRLLQVV